MRRRNIQIERAKSKGYRINYGRLFFSLLVICILILGMVYGVKYGINSFGKKNNAATTNVDIYDESGENANKNENVAETPKEPEKYTLTISAGGDLLIHDTIFKSVKLSNGTYNFKPVFENVKYIFEDSDLSVINLEVPVAGNKFAPSNYPAFNSPVELLDAVKDMGIDVVSTANNHALDKRYAGLEATIENATSKGIKVIGTARVKEETEPIIIEKNNIKIGITSYTYGTNGIPIPKDYPFCVNIIDKDKMLEDIKYMKDEGADFVFFVLHFGQEYQLTPNTTQTALVDFLVKNGVDVIFGSHPHVPQPYELKEVTLADGTKKQAFVIYSLGNFVSNQTDYYTKMGGIATVNLSKKGDEKKIESYKVTPIYTYVKGAGINKFKVVPLEKAIYEYDKGVKTYSSSDITKFTKLLKDANYIYNKLK